MISKGQALKIYNDTLGDSLGKTKDINQAEKILAEKAETYIKITALKAQANALFTIAAEKTAEALIAQQTLVDKGLLDEGGFVGRAADNMSKIANKAIEDGKKIEAMGAGLLKQAGQLSKDFNINTGVPAGNTPVPRANAVKKESEDVQLIFSQEYENLLLKQAEFQAKFGENRQKFIEEGMRLEQAEFDEKFALLNLELDIEEAAAKKKVELAEWERNARVTAANDIGIALGALSDLIGKETAAGKALAIAQAVINTWLGVTEVLKQKSVLPEPFATISRIASITTVIASGLNAVKNIGKAKVPGSGSGSSASIGGGSVAAPLQPRAPGATNTLLDQQQLNQIGNAATVRAFVIETDVSSNQERIRRLNRAARI